MKLRPFFPYFGSKWRAVPRYPEPRFETIVEPFAGAAGYAVRHHEARVYLNDLDPVLACVWRYLIDATPDEIMALPLAGEFERTADIDAPAGARALVGFWINPGSVAPKNVPSAWCRNNQTAHPGSVWSPRTRERIASQVESIRHWKVASSSYSDLLNVEATWYVDPPYQLAGKHYTHGAKALDFEHLGAWCESRRGQVIVCENEGATWLPFRTLGTIKATASRGRAGVSHEVIWTNDLCDVVIEGVGRCVQRAGHPMGYHSAASA